MKQLIILVALIASIANADLVSNGIAINEHTLITTSHGVFGTDSGKAVVDGTFVSLKLLVQSKQEDIFVDLAIVTVPDSIHLNACQIAPIFAEDGETVELYGKLDDGTGFKGVSMKGKVSDYDERMPFEYVYSIGAKVRRGMSGGPLYYNGHIIGMNVAYRYDDDVSYSYTYDILMQYIEEAKIKPMPNTRDNKKCVYPIIGYTHDKTEIRAKD